VESSVLGDDPSNKSVLERATSFTVHWIYDSKTNAGCTILGSLYRTGHYNYNKIIFGIIICGFVKEITIPYDCATARSVWTLCHG
jgi:hypothetical protein